MDHLYYDCVVHLGLGVYDNHTTIMIEDGATNQRRGKVCHRDTLHFNTKTFSF